MKINKLIVLLLMASTFATAGVAGEVKKTNIDSKTVKSSKPELSKPKLDKKEAKKIKAGSKTVTSRKSKLSHLKVDNNKNKHKRVVPPEIQALQAQIQKAQIQKIDLSFEEAYQLMLANNNAMKAILQEVDERAYEKKAARGHSFPTIGLSSVMTHFDDTIAVDTPSIHLPPALGGRTLSAGPITLQDQNLWMTNVGATWHIFTGGKIMALNAAARAKLEGSNEKYRALTNELISELVKRYYGLRMSQDVVVVRKQVLDGVKRHLDDAIKLEEAGIIAKGERLHADVAYAQALRDYQASVRDASVIEEGLKILIKANEVDLNNVKVTPASSLFVYGEEFTKLDEYKQLALANNPNLKQMEVKKKLAQANYKSHAADYMPVVSLFAYDTIAKQNMSYQIPSWAVGGSVNMVLFDGLTRYNELKSADSFRKQVDYEIKDARNNIAGLVTKQYQELMKHKEQYECTDAALEKANEAVRVSTLAFNEGFGTSLAVIDAQMALSGVKIARLNAIYNYDVSLAELLRTGGKAEEVLKYMKNSTTEKL